MSNDTQVTWLTQEAHDRLQAELEQLRGPARTEIAQRIEAAREEGDLKENGGYHAAKDEQGKIEARIRQLTELLKHATVGEADFDGTVEPGTVVTATIAGDDSTFLVGNREIVADGADLTVYSPSSPVGASIMGLRAGDATSYTAPNGREIAVTVQKVERYEP
ncbi:MULTISPECIES: transcription elongation factor GreA [unclassified Curtobacterium]|uniref:transcription elongation factor GreA n=1 Tax=unclassified Curtobacterium TaxID=257496 RepID=UPI000DA9C6A7|nr:MULTISPECIES: transcription elongation factor GreA [unclassified Curtobacterium]PZE25389.1 transcription elongation factor GreA [Curtobacterium sp. MCBD17_028]PZE75415.1 transcription elongation factor GreA [Curtobacterium sp. MCBD17_019]PZF58029.1 transcription elongation factor GreA [Curtobacterium sp. MCBD17_034]PZF61446.1 transcription elongation factor GreA [Curtobacterium sp. MCBD17_013]PZM33221.1 transcription elongation factor GreA [Curtobacterium sp. MCBD17_031]